MRRNAFTIAAACLLALGAIGALHVQAMDGNGSPWKHMDTITGPGGSPLGAGPGTGGGHPTALLYPDGTNGCVVPACGPGGGSPYSVYYPPLSDAACLALGPPSPAPQCGTPCMVSPQCIAFPSLSSSFGSFGTPPPSGNDGSPASYYKQPNECAPAGVASLPVPVATNLDGTPLKPTWSPIESLTNDHAASNQYVKMNSIARTPFPDPPAGPTASQKPPLTTPSTNYDTYAANPYNSPYVFGNGRFHLDNQALLVTIDQPGTTGLLFTANGDPHSVEGVPDDQFVMLGDDGYILGQFDTAVQDLPGYDFQVNTVQSGTSFGTFCIYGADSLHPQGPFTLVHSAFVDAASCDTTLDTTVYCPDAPGTMTTTPCPLGTTCFHFDLSYFYTPHRAMCGLPCTGGMAPGELSYFLVVNSWQHTPYLKTDFEIQPLDNSESCIDLTGSNYDWSLGANDVAYPACPNPAFAGNPLRNFVYDFKDRTVRFGYPVWRIWSDNDNGGSDTAPFNIADTHADPVSEWYWDFSSDPYATGPLPQYPDPYGPVQPAAPQDRWPIHGDYTGGSFQHLTDSTNHDRSHRYFSPGVFPACHSTSTMDQTQIDPPDPPGTTSTMWLVTWRQSDPPNSDVYPYAFQTINAPPPLPNQGIMNPANPTHAFPEVRLNGEVRGAKDMFCRPVTVWNQRPIAGFVYSPVGNDPFLFHFMDTTADPDWYVPTGGHPNAFTNVYGAPVCATCPSDGIQKREWIFDEADGHTFDPVGATLSGHGTTLTSTAGDVQWTFVSREAKDGMSWDPKWPATPPLLDLAQDGLNNPSASDPCETTADAALCFTFAQCNNANSAVKNVLCSTAAAFTANDIGATVTGFGIPAGTTITGLVYYPPPPSAGGVPVGVTLSQNIGPSYVSDPLTKYFMDFVISWPWQPIFEPSYDYPTTGDYTVKMSVCDHDYMVSIPVDTQAPPVPLQYGTTPAGLPDETALYGDPRDVTWDTPTTGTSAHACDTITVPLNIPNHPPHVTVPPHFVVHLNGVVSFTAVGSDADRGQTLQLRLCPGQQLSAGITFDPIEVNGMAVDQVFTWEAAGLPIGRYGPICFEIADGRYVNGVFQTFSLTHALTTIYVADENTDTDLDGIVDLADNCPGTANHDQLDSDRDGVGDACEVPDGGFDATPPKPVHVEGIVDVDQDGVADSADNCVGMATRDQSDVDGDTRGDLCDADADGDGVPNAIDNCPLKPNPRQEDANRDGGGDICAGAGSPVKGGVGGLPVSGDSGPLATDSTWGIVVGSAIGILAMAAVLVPLLYFALRRRDGDK